MLRGSARTHSPQVSMERIPEFVSTHLFLISLFVALLVMLAWNLFGAGLTGVEGGATEPATWRLLSHWRELLPPNPGEDRTRLYHERVQRNDFVSNLASSSAPAEDEAGALRALDLSVKIRKADRLCIKRVVELGKLAGIKPE